jgi:membrane protease YdiL (CAAX protease family)
MVLSISFVFAWIRMRSASLWPAVLLHATHNAVIQQFLDPMTVDRGHTNYFIGEFGCAMLPFVIFAAWWVWKHRGEVDTAQASTAIAA